MGIDQTRTAWEAAAPGWARWEGTVTEWMRPATDRMLAHACIAPGAVVLDVACGAGSQSLAAARCCGPEGEVIATDIAQAMLAHVQEQARAAGLHNVRTLAAPAEQLPLEEASCDAAICQLGLMLFDEPDRALAAIRRALRPGARAAFVVFTTPQANAMLSQPMQVLMRHAGRSPVPGRPGLFALGAPGQLEGLLGAAEFTDVRVDTVPVQLRMPDAAHALRMMQEAFGAYRAVVAQLSEAARADAWTEVRQVLAGFDTSDGFVAGTEVLVASGMRR